MGKKIQPAIEKERHCFICNDVLFFETFLFNDL